MLGGRLVVGEGRGSGAGAVVASLKGARGRWSTAVERLRGRSVVAARVDAFLRSIVCREEQYQWSLLPDGSSTHHAPNPLMPKQRPGLTVVSSVSSLGIRAPLLTRVGITIPIVLVALPTIFVAVARRALPLPLAVEGIAGCALLSVRVVLLRVVGHGGGRVMRSGREAGVVRAKEVATRKGNRDAETSEAGWNRRRRGVLDRGELERAKTAA